ncbi:CobD/CbiB family cobalamin biosynthesis protein [Marilutibacter spongiae]|uniref:Cobalamin biosynthesis protein CobD n=1 Tax=Marilutibacter spongiae TaxID=2025720 RepID=A0A7W3TIW8_9GAMM|nr:CobD/CbiB family cobalamin biosynthesis protein [Lysobacter spongiae]MBB1059155.1 cobalamin biosynthesis protein [Lysobacter spongiae]
MSGLPVLVAMTAAIALDAVFGEPRRWHPLVGFGRWARQVERALYDDARARGLLAWALAVLPPLTAISALSLLAGWAGAWMAACVDAACLYFALGLRSLGEHARPVATALEAGRLDDARSAVGRMVSRDTGALDATGVAAAATESVLENGNDAVFGALFWCLLLGGPGVVLYRLANTLDATWGYRTPRLARFGWAAARIDDAMNWIPARLTALSYALLGRTRNALACWHRQAPAWDSPNAGPVMASGAGAIGVRLGGPARYHGRWEERPRLGEGAPADAASIDAALRLVRRTTALWLLATAAAVLLGALLGGRSHA